MDVKRSNRTKSTRENEAEPKPTDTDPGRLSFPADEPEAATEARTEPASSANGNGSDSPKATATEAIPPEPGRESESPPDPFDPARLRLSQDFSAAVGVRKLLTTVPVRKPEKTWWVRAHPDESYRLQTAVLELKEERETYLVDRPLWEALATEPTFAPALLVTSITRPGVLFLWQLRLPGPDGKVNPWHQSALDAAERARSAWVRVYADMHLGAYRMEESTAIRDDPAWPSESFGELLKIAFRDRLISEWDHPVLKRLRGEA